MFSLIFLTRIFGTMSDWYHLSVAKTTELGRELIGPCLIIAIATKLALMALAPYWTDNLGYWLNSNKLVAFAKEVSKTNGNRIENQDVIDAVAGWGLTDENGNILIPVIHANNNDNIDILCKSITDKLSNAVKDYCSAWYPTYGIPSERLGQIIFYHEVMWDLLKILESKKLITMPPILKGEEVSNQHFGDICFIVIDASNN